jgi:hypothetical protein
MPREQTPIRPIQVDYRCDSCNEGYYRPNGIVLTSMPPQFPHECSNCGDSKVFTEKYPTVRYTLEDSLLDMESYQQQTM